ncbi:putative periplasmic pentaheme cytochrome c [Desulfuromonas sp. DDH964]|uniref:cytochrome c3 family protein n=1 Tax=Desulfuromonas sp. DDH964 TaxID=1823759 RepID=UPI00078C1024|nr:cytochrome c3 family protein [Desulfuromonas sp. DDH964]AMV72902.1 putative periplasmic pentaheme cytochrome c [Desulfuromonas sp. DDH964]
MLLLRICLLVALTALALSSLPASPARAGEGPDSVTIDAMSALYGEVVFDHAMHESVAEDCATCHHHTTGSAPQAPQCGGCHAAGQPAATVSCQGCHLARPFSAEALRRKGENINLYHADKVGLQAAYHLSCMGCHEEMGGPRGCEDCHARTDAGDAFYHAGNYAPPMAPAGGSGH